MSLWYIVIGSLGLAFFVMGAFQSAFATTPRQRENAAVTAIIGVLFILVLILMN